MMAQEMHLVLLLLGHPALTQSPLPEVYSKHHPTASLIQVTQHLDCLSIVAPNTSAATVLL